MFKLKAFLVTVAIATAVAAQAQFGAKISGQANNFTYDVVPSDKVDFSNTTGEATSEAHADMHTGTLKGLARAAGGEHTYAQFLTRLSDDLTITGPGDQEVPMTFTLDVNMSRAWDNALGLQQSEVMTGSARMEVLVNSGAIHITNQYHSTFSREGSVDGNGDPSVNIFYDAKFDVGTGQVLAESHDEWHVIMSANFMVKPGDDVSFVKTMVASAQGDKGVACQVDALHSGHVSVTLPDGYGFTSQTGAFLNPVPEPSSLAVLGLGLLPILRRRTRK